MLVKYWWFLFLLLVVLEKSVAGKAVLILAKVNDYPVVIKFLIDAGAEETDF
jgi:hypothetical protein